MQRGLLLSFFHVTNFIIYLSKYEGYFIFLKKKKESFLNSGQWDEEDETLQKNDL